MSATDPQSPQELQLPFNTQEQRNPAEEQMDRVVDILTADQHSPAEKPENAWLQVDSKVTDETKPVELSIVMPCLDEADTVGTCILKALHSLEKMGIRGEVIVADNGSRDDSVEIAESLGARVVHVDRPGYGAALMGGIEAAKGRYVLMGDADDSYDFSQAHKFYEQIKDGQADLVQGCRLAAGGGRVMPGAMPWLHQWGNPALTWMVRKMFRAKIHDVYCGMRIFSKEHYTRLDQRCTGMEFATEMIIKSTLFGAKISEVPITLHPDGRKTHAPHLRTFRDGWRTLRFFLLLSPKWSFIAPGAMLALLGVLGCFLVMAKLTVAGVVFEAHTLLLSVLALLVSFQLGSFGLLAKSFAATEGILPKDARVERFCRRFTLERCLLGAAGLIAAGIGTIIWQTLSWGAGGFGNLDYSVTMLRIIPAAGAVAIGAQLAFSSLMLRLIRLARR
ncbi:MAG: glycosyltransferase family 2 protein [Planctomycetota bacterium]